MLEWGFRNFETRTLFAANQPVGYAKVFGGESRSVKLASPEPIKVMVPKNGSEKLIARIVYKRSGAGTGAMPARRSASSRSGAAPMSPMEAPVYAAEAVGTGSTMRRAIDGASELVIGMFRAGAEKL